MAYKLSTQFHTIVTFPIFLIIGFILSPFIILSTCIISIYRHIIYLILINKYGSKFGGLVSARDVFFGTIANRKEVISNVVIFKCNRNNTNNFYDHVKKTMSKKFNEELTKHPKMLSHIRNYLGYFYLVNNQVTVDECFKKLETPPDLNKTDFLRIMSEHFNKPLPHNHQVLWELLIGTQPIKWREQTNNDDVEFYPLVFRCNHVLSDGYQMLLSFVTHFGDTDNFVIESVVNEKEKSFGANQIESEKFKLSKFAQKIERLWYNIKWCLTQAYYAESILAQLFFNVFLISKTNLLYGSALSNERIYVTRFVESQKYFKRFKIIKNHIPKSNFTGILLTAVSSSLGEYYFKQQSKCDPSHINIYLPESPQCVQATKMIAEKSIIKDVVCHNSLAASLIRVPIFFNQKESNMSLIKRAQELQKEINFFRDPDELMLKQKLYNAFYCLFPIPVTRFFTKMFKVTAAVSNIPGVSKFTAFGGYTVEEIVPFTINKEFTGITLVLFTYNKKLQFYLIVDKALIPSETAAYSILDGIYKYIDLLYDECITISNGG